MSEIRPAGVSVQPYQYMGSGLSNIRKVSNPVEQNNQPKGMSKGKKITIATVAAALLGIGAVVITKGRAAAKAAYKAKLLADIPPELQTRFSAIKDLKDKEFVDRAYSELVEYMGLKGVAPKEVAIKNADGILCVTGGYSSIDNTIEFSEGFLTKLNKERQIGMMAHELRHCKQYTDMLRTEGITVENYVESVVKSMMERAKNNVFNVQYRFAYNNAKEQGKLQEFLAKVKKQWTEDLSKQVRKNYKDVLAMPKIKADSPEGMKAYENLKANSEYVGLGFLGTGSDAYRNNLLEVDAYAFGDKMKEMFEKFIKAVNI